MYLFIVTERLDVFVRLPKSCVVFNMDDMRHGRHNHDGGRRSLPPMEKTLDPLWWPR